MKISTNTLIFFLWEVPDGSHTQRPPLAAPTLEWQQGAFPRAQAWLKDCPDLKQPFIWWSATIDNRLVDAAGREGIG